MSAQETFFAEPNPCAGCRFAQRCGDEELACDAFLIFASGAVEARWKHAPRAPSAAKFAVVFREERAS